MMCFSCIISLGESEIPPIGDGDMVFIFEDESYGLGMPSLPLIDAVEGKYGSPMEMLETESCMFEGMDKEFSNDDIVLGTYPINHDQLETVMVFSPEYTTIRGAAVGMSEKEVAALYGNDYMKDYDQMIYSVPTGGSIIFTLDMETNLVICWALIFGAAGV